MWRFTGQLVLNSENFAKRLVDLMPVKQRHNLGFNLLSKYGIHTTGEVRGEGGRRNSS